MKGFNRNFNLMIIGQIISLFGATILKFALSLYVLDLTGRADIFATILAISTIPVIFLSPIGGAIADRFNRRNLMVIFDFSSSAVVLIFALCLLGGDRSVLLIGVIMTVLSVISTMYQPTVQSSIPFLAEEDNLIKANGVVSGVGALTNIAGPILGGVLYGFVGLKAIVVVSCISFFLSAVMELFIKIPFAKQEQTGNIITTIFVDMKKGLSYIIKQNPFIVKIMTIAAALNIFLVPLFLVGIPYIVKITMGGSDVVFGVAQGVVSCSTILAAIVVGIIGKRLKVHSLYIYIVSIGLVLVPMALAVHPLILNLGFILPLVLFILCAFLIMFSTTIVSIFAITLVQKQTPNELLGKVMAILFAVSSCAAPIGQMIYGALIDGFHDRVYIPILIASVLTLVVAFVGKAMLQNENKDEE